MNIFGLASVGRFVLYERCNKNEIVKCKFHDNVEIVTSINHLKGNLFIYDRNNVEKLLRNKNVRMFVYTENASYLGVTFGCLGPCYIRGPGIKIDLGENSVYRFWTYVSPEARGLHVYTKLMQSFVKYYENYDKLISLVDPSNIIVCKMMKKIGSHRRKMYFFLKIKNISFVIEKDLTRFKINFYVSNIKKNNLFSI